MEILKYILTIIGISTASLSIIVTITSGLFTSKIIAKKIAFVLGSICLVNTIVFISIFGTSTMFTISIIFWIFGLMGLASDIMEG